MSLEEVIMCERWSVVKPLGFSLTQALASLTCLLLVGTVVKRSNVLLKSFTSRNSLGKQPYRFSTVKVTAGQASNKVNARG